MLNQSIYALVIWNLGKWNSVKWNETRASGAIFASFWVARVCQRQLGFLVLIAIGITVPWLFICLSRLCIMLKQLTISAVFLLHTTVLCLSEPLHPQILPQHDPRPVYLSVGDIRWQIASLMVLVIAPWSQWRAYGKPPSLFWMVPSLTPLPFTKNWGSKCAPRTNFATINVSFMYERCSLLPNCFGPCLSCICVVCLLSVFII